jgi:hypothetical protein
MKKILFLLCILILISGCQNEETTITEEGSFNQNICQEKNLTGKYIMIKSAHCSACQATIQDFKSACQEKNIHPIILDLSKQEDIKKFKEYNLSIQYTPTFILNCDYYIGAKTKEEYLKFLNKNE